MDLTSSRLMYLKAGLFVLLGAIAGGLILLDRPDVKTAALLCLTVWSFSRAYYFAFYVIEHYIDPSYRYAGLMSFVRHVVGRRRGGA